MAHHYTTDAIVLARRSRGEGNAVLSLFTKDFGLVYGVARSVRQKHSKLRGMLQNGLVGQVTLVRGSRSWKVVGVIEEQNALFRLKEFPLNQQLAARVLTLVERLVHGEEKNEQLFAILKSFFSYLTPQLLTDQELGVIERLIALRLLACLGYTTLEPTLQRFVESVEITEEYLKDMGAIRSLATKEINKALEAAQL